MANNKEEKVALLRLIGLSDQKIDETLKNESLTLILIETISIVNNFIHY